MNEDKIAAAAAHLTETYEAFIDGLLKHGINTWELVEACGMDPDHDGDFHRYWDMRVGR